MQRAKGKGREFGGYGKEVRVERKNGRRATAVRKREGRESWEGKERDDSREKKGRG